MVVPLKRIVDVVRRTRGCVVSNAIEPHFIPGMGIGIVACAYIPKDTLVFQAGHDAWYPFQPSMRWRLHSRKLQAF
ncbi:hypothetical protein KXD40_001224 [Peronospora effusa]|nr:hypothetical protein KXD40_001224 [Peronospora effusa]